MVQTPTEVLDQWKTYLEEMQANDAWMARHQEIDHQRLKVLPEMRILLGKYLGGETTTAQFSEIFQTKAALEWEAFGLKGMNGAMFLMKLARHFPDEQNLAFKLRTAMKAPQSPDEARSSIRTLAAYLEELIDRGLITRTELQPARGAVFQSAWWHIQSPESWPIFLPATIEAFEHEGLFLLKNDLSVSYMEYRQVSQALRAALGLNAWQIEHLCAWLTAADRSASPAEAGSGQTQPAETATASAAADESTQAFDEPEAAPPVQALWALAKIGRKFNCRIWVASPGQDLAWKDESISSMSIPELPRLEVDDASQRIIQRVGMAWLRGEGQVSAVFELVDAASLYTGLLRLADLAALAPNLAFPLYIVAPEASLGRVRSELSRPAFRAIELHQYCSYFSIEELMREMENILRWAKDPIAMNNLAKKVDPSLRSE